MINYILLSEKEEGLLQAALLKRISNVNVHTLEYKGGLKMCAFIQMFFETGISLIITTGNLADNITLLDETDFFDEKSKYKLQEGVEMKVSPLDSFEEIIGRKLINVEGIQKPDEEYYWQLDFVFETGTLHVEALIDEINYSLVQKAVE